MLRQKTPTGMTPLMSATYETYTRGLSCPHYPLECLTAVFRLVYDNNVFTIGIRKTEKIIRNISA